MGSISHHNTSLVINSLNGGDKHTHTHTHTYTNIHTHTDDPRRINLKKLGVHRPQAGAHLV